MSNYAANLAADALHGRRIGVIRSHYGAGKFPEIEAILASSIDSLRAQGAEIVDSIDIDMEGVGDAEYEVLLYEFKDGLNRYLEGSRASIESLEAVIAFNDAHSETVMPFFGQDVLELAQSKGPLTDESYLAALETSKRRATQGIDNALSEHGLDALIAVTNGPAWFTDHVNGDAFHIGSSSYAAVSGYPNITVPAGFVSGLPVGLSFIGPAFSEKALIEIAYAFEQATLVRRPPEL